MKINWTPKNANPEYDPVWYYFFGKILIRSMIEVKSVGRDSVLYDLQIVVFVFF